MYVPKHFEETNVGVMHALMREHPLATLVTLSGEGLDANHVPLLVEPGPTPFGTLTGHIARSNPMLEALRGEAEVLAIFHGPQAYISPSWYATKAETGKVVPTWNYVVVHAHGKLVVRDEPDWVRQQIETLTGAMESGFDDPWAVSDAPADFTDKLIGAVVGIEIVITKMTGKWKVSQNQPELNRRGVIEGLTRTGAPQAMAMARLVGSGK